MNENRFPWPPEFWQLVECANDEPLTAEQTELLTALLADNPAAQRDYLAHIQLQADLHLLGRAQRSLEKALDRLNHQLPDSSSLDGETIGSVQALPLAPPADSDDLIIPPPDALNWRFPGPAAWGWMMFGLAVIGFFAFWLTGQSHDGAKVAGLAPEPVSLPSVHILSGTTKLLLPKIGHVIVDGPAEFDMLSPMRARLKEGRARVRVTEETGRGFVVETPYGNITDLGTEFAIDVPKKGGRAKLVVFDGAVDLDRPAKSGDEVASPQVDRLVRGEGVAFQADGRLDRIVSIVTGETATFHPSDELGSNAPVPTILSVSDNLCSSDTKKFYEIVPQGLREDSPAYVDRPGYEWNGFTHEGIPEYLIEADYVKPFNNDKVQRPLRLSVTLSRPAKLFVFLFDDDRYACEIPGWLKDRFTKTGDFVGLDLVESIIDGRKYMPGFKRGIGPGNSIDHRFSIWETRIDSPGVITLGPNKGESFATTSMYGIAAVAMEQVGKKTPDGADASSTVHFRE